MAKVKRFLPLLIIAAFMLTAYLMGWQRYLSLDHLQAMRTNFPLTAPLLFILLYATATALSFPGGLFLSIIGGFLFGIPFATLYVVIGATMGASIIFWAARTAFAPALKKKAGPFLKKLRGGFQKNEISYMLFLRLVPLFPFWLINIAPAFLSVRFLTYVWTTFVGIIPGAYIYTQAGSLLSESLMSGEELSLAAILNWKMRLLLIAIGLLALIPIVIKKIRDRH